MPRQRTASGSTEYSRATIEDRSEGVDNLTILDEDGNSVNVGADTPLPTEIDSAVTNRLSIGIEELINQTRKTNEYLSILTGVEL